MLGRVVGAIALSSVPFGIAVARCLEQAWGLGELHVERAGLEVSVGTVGLEPISENEPVLVVTWYDGCDRIVVDLYVGGTGELLTSECLR